MTTTEQAEIDHVKAKIKEYEVFHAQAIRDGNEDREKRYVDLITESLKTLHDLNLQQRQGKVNIPHYACLFSICCFEIIPSSRTSFLRHTCCFEIVPLYLISSHHRAVCFEITL